MSGKKMTDAAAGGSVTKKAKARSMATAVAGLAVTVRDGSDGSRRGLVRAAAGRRCGRYSGTPQYPRYIIECTRSSELVCSRRVASIVKYVKNNGVHVAE